jgi:monoamine oxidase
MSILVLEARDRIGGRISTKHDPLSSVPIELGAEFVHGQPPELWREISAGRLRAVKVEGEDLYRGSRERAEEDDTEEDVDSLLKNARPREDEPFSRFLNRKKLNQESKRAITGYIEGFNAAPADSIGIQGLIRQQKAEDQIDSDQLYRILNGYDAVPLMLFRSLHNAAAVLRLNTVVTHVIWRRGRVEVRARSGLGEALAPIQARFAAITAPLGVLQAGAGDHGAILFDPDPAVIRRAGEQLAMGDVVRVTFRFRTSFWESNSELANLSFLHAPDAALPTWWTQSPVRAPVVTAWAGGPRAAKYMGCEPSAIVSIALDAMSQVFQIERPRIVEELAGWHYHDWRNDPFSRGAYSYVPAGALRSVDALTRPVENTLFFAGEALDVTGHWGTVHGAIRSAEHAAAQIRAAACPKPRPARRVRKSE